MVTHEQVPKLLKTDFQRFYTFTSETECSHSNKDMVLLLRSQELLLSPLPGAVGIAHLMMENRSGNFSAQTHPAVCIKHQFVRED